MAFLVFILSFVLLAAEVAGGYLSLDLLPTPAGTLYALAGAVSVVGAFIVLVLGLLIMRVGRLTTVVRQQAVAAANSGLRSVRAGRGARRARPGGRARRAVRSPSSRSKSKPSRRSGSRARLSKSRLCRKFRAGARSRRGAR